MRYAEKEKKNNLNSDKNMYYSEIIRFDHIIRKALKVCEKESQENNDFETIDKLWFYILDQMFEIKSK